MTFLTIIFLFFPAHAGSVQVNGDDLEKELKPLSNLFEQYYLSGDFANAEKTARSYFNYPLTDYLKGVAYSKLALVYISLSRFDEAMEYTRKIEKLDLNDTEGLYLLPFTYVAEAIIFEKKRSYFQAIEYIEKAIRIYKTVDLRDDYFIEALSTAYNNLGTYFNELGAFANGLSYLESSLKMKETYGLANKGVTITSIARSYVGLKAYDRAEEYFRSCIETSIEEYGRDYYRLPELFFNFGEFLQNTGRKEEARTQFRSGMIRCLKAYGVKHDKTSRAYSLMAGNCLLSGEIDSSLFYFQRSLIAVSPNFNDPDISKNPLKDSAFLEIRLMENLKGKSRALEALSERQPENEKLKTLNLSLETIGLAMDLIDKIRNNYPSEETKMYLAGNEKETYMSAMRVASSIYSITGEQSFLDSIYGIALRAKAAVLRNQISDNNLIYSSGLPRSLQKKMLSLFGNIAGYNKLLLDESGFPAQDQDSVKISMWKDELFRLNREKEFLTDSISALYPQYAAVLRKTTPVSPAMVREKLEKDETILDYFISNRYSGGKRRMYIFLVTRKSLKLIEQKVDSAFALNASMFRNDSGMTFSVPNYITALHYFYVQLIEPVEKMLNGKRLIIIPDEEINLLPFDAFLKKSPGRDKNDFDGLRFLVNDYAFSHSYSASLLPEDSPSSGKKMVYSFSPSYGMETGYDSLEGAVREIRNINTVMKGRSYTFDRATKSAFMNSLQDPVIFHLAMHSITDSSNSLYSYLLFNGSEAARDSSRLYNYEVSLVKISSPMIVLSSCNSGTGKLYSGEGQMSLARSFILAGASSVVRTAWDVNDYTGSAIITRFYHYLSQGNNKDRAMQLAKIDYIKDSSPAFRDPYYWAAYEIVGDNGPVTAKKRKIVTFVTIFALLSGACLIYFFRRRSIFSAGSR